MGTDRLDERDPDGNLRRRAADGCAASAALLAASEATDVDAAREAEIDALKQEPAAFVEHEHLAAAIAALADAAE